MSIPSGGLRTIWHRQKDNFVDISPLYRMRFSGVSLLFPCGINWASILGAKNPSRTKLFPARINDDRSSISARCGSQHGSPKRCFSQNRFYSRSHLLHRTGRSLSRSSAIHAEPGITKPSWISISDCEGSGKTKDDIGEEKYNRLIKRDLDLTRYTTNPSDNRVRRELYLISFVRTLL